MSAAREVAGVPAGRIRAAALRGAAARGGVPQRTKRWGREQRGPGPDSAARSPRRGWAAGTLQGGWAGFGCVYAGEGA